MQQITISVMDWLINKPITLRLSEGAELPKVGSYILYRGDGDKTLVGTYIGYPVESTKTGEFLEILSGEKLDKFHRYHRKSSDLFMIFKQEFKKYFPQTKPVTARSNWKGDTVYLYFYCDERLDFSSFVRYFRTKMPVKFFLYQIGARDMVRLSPHAKEWLSECGCGPIGCCGTGPLPTVEMENIALQSLEGRDTEKLKGRCGKLKCSIVYEKALYLEELEKYPYKGQAVVVDETTNGICIGHNIMSGEIVIKSESGDVIRANTARIKFNMSDQKQHYATLFANQRIDDNE